jgi:hypothetical protein
MQKTEQKNNAEKFYATFTQKVHVTQRSIYLNGVVPEIDVAKTTPTMKLTHPTRMTF